MPKRKLPYEMSTYLILPVRKKGHSEIQSCLYFDWSGIQVGPDELQSNAQGFDSAFVCLRQTSLDELKDRGAMLPDDTVAVQDLSLFGAVAKTRDQSFQMPTMFSAVDKDGFKTLVLPVFAGSRRSVILVFADAVGRLIATSDPEIKNSTGG